MRISKMLVWNPFFQTLTRLHRSGVASSRLPILLGHRKFDSTTIYTRIECEELRPLVCPWPAQ